MSRDLGRAIPKSPSFNVATNGQVDVRRRHVAVDDGHGLARRRPLHSHTTEERNRGDYGEGRPDVFHSCAYFLSRSCSNVCRNRFVVGAGHASESCSIRPCTSADSGQSLLDEEITERTIQGKLADWYPQLNFSYYIQHNSQLPVSIIQGEPPLEDGLKNASTGEFSLSQMILQYVTERSKLQK